MASCSRYPRVTCAKGFEVLRIPSVKYMWQAGHLAQLVRCVVASKAEGLMNSTIAIARARTVLEELLRPAALRQAREDAVRVWSSVRPKLTLSGETTPSNRMARFARNIVQ